MSVKSVAAALFALAPLASAAAPVEVLFVGNSFTFGRYDPVMSYNTANVTDLTRPERGAPFDNPRGSNVFEPHPWGGVAGIFKQFTVQAGLDYDVSLSTRNAASLRGHFLNLNPADWDLRGNIASQKWDKVVLQEQSDDPLPRLTNAAGVVLDSNPPLFNFYANKIEDFIRTPGKVSPFRDRDAFPGANGSERQAACEAAGVAAGTCSRVRSPSDEPFENNNANPDAELYLYQTWAKPQRIDGAFVTETDETTGAVTRLTDLSDETFYDSLEAMTDDLVDSFDAAFAQAKADGTPGFKAIAPVGEAFLRAVQDGVATRDFWADDALTDGLIDLWFDDGLHASTHGSYLSALVLFGTLTGLDPASLGRREIAARDLRIGARDALRLQRVASDQLGFVAPIPLPASGVLALLGLGMLRLAARRRRAA